VSIGTISLFMASSSFSICSYSYDLIADSLASLYITSTTIDACDMDFSIVYSCSTSFWEYAFSFSSVATVVVVDVASNLDLSF
jgi:hypothetical protein